LNIVSVGRKQKPGYASCGRHDTAICSSVIADVYEEVLGSIEPMRRRYGQFNPGTFIMAYDAGQGSGDLRLCTVD